MCKTTTVAATFLEIMRSMSLGEPEKKDKGRCKDIFAEFFLGSIPDDGTGKPHETKRSTYTLGMAS